jgi:hypothetical protein
MQGTLGSLDSLKGVPLHLALDNTGVGLVACDGGLHKSRHHDPPFHPSLPVLRVQTREPAAHLHTVPGTPGDAAGRRPLVSTRAQVERGDGQARVVGRSLLSQLTAEIREAHGTSSATG